MYRTCCSGTDSVTFTTRHSAGPDWRAGADLSRVDTSADGIREGARATVNDLVEELRGFGPDGGSDDAGTREGFCRSDEACVQALDAVAELCREEGAAGEANKMAVGEVRICVWSTRGLQKV